MKILECKKLVKTDLQWKKTTFLPIGVIAVFLFVCMVSQPLKAQKIIQDTTVQKEDVIIGKEVIDQPPEFPGGESARRKFLIENVNYPREAKKNNQQGRVMVGFVVEKDGRLTNFTIQESATPLLDAEALRVAKLMPKWIPGKLRGKLVRVQFQMPLTFTLYD